MREKVGELHLLFSLFLAEPQIILYISHSAIIINSDYSGVET